MIVLVTDFGLGDEYVGVMKGVICSINPEVKIIDLTHGISSQDIIWAGIVVYKTCKFFPQGSIFLIVVDPGVGTERDIIIMKAGGYYFIAPDNGVLSLIYEKFNPEIIVKAEKKNYTLQPVSCTFHGRDIFSPLAAHLSRGENVLQMGDKVDRIVRIKFPQPQIREKEIIAAVIHIDRFGNLITSLDREEFEKLGWRRFKIEYKGRTIDEISSCYDTGKDLIAIWESKNFLEIAKPGGCAQEYLQAKPGDEIRIVKLG
ncbi:MAG: hypothetical protein B6D53_00965 [Candidatus Omnitrophica bacterium 4484_49]|nr:MAG: hypothetical protein B6D53_00965 [Candidatus Omnitrophica bacterium 4484_49]